MKNLESFWFFLAWAGLLAVLFVLTGHKLFVFLLILYFLIRLFYLKEKSVLIWAFLVFILLFFRAQGVTFHAVSELNEEENEWMLELKRHHLKLNGDRLQVRASVLKEDGKEDVILVYRLTSPEEKETYLNEDLPLYVHVRGELKAPKGQRNFNQFDYASYLRRQGVFWLLEADQIQASSHKEKNKIFRVKQWPYYCLRWVEETIPGKTGDYIKALIFSDRRSLESSVLEDFQKLGMIHILSISGLHISIVIRILRYVFYRLSFTREHFPCFLLVSLTAYGFICDWSISVFRSITQSHLRSLGQIMGWSLTSLDRWSISLILALLIQPQVIFSLGFQLFYALSLILLLLVNSSSFQQSGRAKKHLLQIVVINLTSLPFLLYHNFEFPLLSIVMNSLLIPIFSNLLIPSLLLYTFLALFLSGRPIFTGSQKILDHSFNFLESIIGKLSEWSPAQWATGRLSFWAMLVLIASILLILYQLNEVKARHPKLCVITCLLLALSVTSEKWLPQTRVVMLDVGQGDCLLIKRPFWQKSVLIDTGGQLTFPKEDWQKPKQPYQLGQSVVIPVMKSLGLSSLDCLLITHADHDHCGEMKTIMESIPVDQVILSQHSLSEEKMHRQLSSIYSPRTDIKILKQEKIPYTLDEDHAILWPETGKNLDSNNSSLVLYSKIYQDYWLFTGDIEAEVEDELISRYPRLPVDVLKVGHHGSNSSSQESFIQHIQPSYALISAGLNNRYGHPHEEVIQTLEKENVIIYRTDQDASVQWIYRPWQKKPSILQVQDEEQNNESSK